jgi:hypothetical protein
MIPNLHIHEQLMYERVKALQQEFEQQRLLKRAPRPRIQIARRGATSLGRFLGAVRARLISTSLTLKKEQSL